MEDIYGVSDYLIENNYKNIAIWGVNELSLLLGDELSKCDDIKSVYVYGNAKKKEGNKIDIFAYNVDVIWVDSIETIYDSTDVIIISDLSSSIYIKHKKLLYISKLLYEIDNLNTSKLLGKYCTQLNNKGVKTLCVSIPNLNKIKNLREVTKEICDKLKGNSFIKFFKLLSIQEKDFLFDSLGGNNYVSEFEKSFNSREYSIIEKTGKEFFRDCQSKYINSVNGIRVTIDNPIKYDNSIYLIGPCIVDGMFAEDKHTVGSYLQSILSNNKYIYCVQAMTSLKCIKFYAFDFINLKKGDIVVFIDSEKYFDNPNLDMQVPFNELYKKEEFFFDCPIHCNYKGYKLVAEEIFKYLIKSNFLTTQKSDSNNLYLENNKEVQKYQKKVFEGNKNLLNYVDKLKTLRVKENKVIGSIVMNCNPFTLGHRYLIEQSLKNVDWLYIFVVEEDKSMFSFEDRFRLIQENTKDLNNITIVPSGNFIISSKTFSAYFSKDTPTETKIDTSTDIEVFAQYIVPALNINTRFVGEEPFDIVTNQYNRSMKDILPKYGVEVRVIPRKKFGEEVISASTVRKLLKQKDFNKIKNFVPSATYDFLLKLMSSKNQI